MMIQTTLNYGCVCGNGLQPNVSEYSLTLPYFVCQEWGNQCVKNCGIDNACSSSCREDHPCGALNPQRANSTNSTTTTSSSTTTASATGLVSGLTGGSSAAQSPSAAPGSPVLDFTGAYGLFVVVGGLVAGAALLL
jgi:hypothetical protein